MARNGLTSASGHGTQPLGGVVLDAALADRLRRHGSFVTLEQPLEECRIARDPREQPGALAVSRVGGAALQSRSATWLRSGRGGRRW